MVEPYIAEIQVARWISAAIKSSFEASGFAIREWPLTQYVEKQIPADALFFSSAQAKLFGLQYKTLYHNGKDHWPLDRPQHDAIQHHRWIFYCFSELRSVADCGIALHSARFYRSSIPFLDEVPAKSYIFAGPSYMRWAAFYRQLQSCRVGVRIHTGNDLVGVMPPVSGHARQREVEQMREYFLADFDRRTLFVEREGPGSRTDR